MTLFNPVDMMGPAHRGPQIQALAGRAAANVMRRNRMKSLLQRGAAGARSMGAGQPVRSSMNPRAIHGRPGVLHGIAAIMAQGAQSAQGRTDVGGSFLNDDGAYGAAGGGYDYPSIPDASDPRQSPVGAGPEEQWPDPNGGGTVGAVQTFANGGAGAPTANPDGTPYAPGNDMGAHMGGWGGAPVPNAYGGPENDPTGSGLIHLGNGMYYDPATDSVRGGGVRR